MHGFISSIREINKHSNLKGENSMDIRFISNEYIFKNDEQQLVNANMSYIDKIATIEFKFNNKLMYYYIMNEDNIKGLNDLDIINKAAEQMAKEPTRWVGEKTDCNYYLNNIDKFVLQERITVYRAIFDETKNHFATISIIEEDGNRFMIRMKDEMTHTTVVTYMDVENRNILIENMENLYGTILNMIKPFKNQEEQIILNEFGKNYVLQSQLEKLHD